VSIDINDKIISADKTTLQEIEGNMKSGGGTKLLYIIDRFEGKWAVIDYNRETFSIPRELVPDNAKAGDIITIDIKVDKLSTEKAQKEVRKLMDSLLGEE